MSGSTPSADSNTQNPQAVMVASSDETTVLTAGTGVSLVTVDINESGTSILSTKITIDASEKTSDTATTPPVVSDTSLTNDSEITIDLDQIDTDNVATGLKVYILGNPT